MRHFRGADTESKGAKRTVGRGVAVAADDQQAGQRQALLGPDHVHDALPPIVEAEQLDPMLGGVFIHLAHHARDLGIADAVAGRSRRHVMIRHAERETGLRNRRAALRQPAEGVKRAFMHVMAIHPEQRIAVLAAHDFVRGPQVYRSGFGLQSCRKRTPREVEGKPI